MTYRLIQCAFWNDPWVIELPPAEKLLYCWMFSNEHTNAAGIYQVGRKTILHETGLAPTLLDRIIDNFMKARKIVYTADNLLWVKNFLRHQPNQSPKVLKRIAVDLEAIKEQGIVDEFLAFNDRVSIPYRYPIDRVCIPTINVNVLSSSSLESKNLKAKKHYSPEEIGAIIAYLNEKAGKAFKPDSELSVTIIRARLEDGWTPEDLKKVIDIKAAKWKGRTTTDKDTGQVTVWDDFLRPSTLFRKSKFEGYRNEAMTGEGRKDDWAERKEAELRKKRGEG